MIVTHNLSLSLVGNLLVGFIAWRLTIFTQIVAAEEKNGVQPQINNKHHQQSNETAATPDHGLDNILKDTIQLLDSLDQRLSVVDNKTLGGKRDPKSNWSFRVPPLADSNKVGDADLLSLALGFSSERRNAAAESPLVSDPPAVAAFSPNEQQPVAATKKVRQLSDQVEEQQQPASLGRSTDNDFIEKHIRFSLDLMRAVFASQSYSSKSNVVDSFLISPVSIQMVLMMMHLGARGQTKRELSNSLHLVSSSSVMTSNKNETKVTPTSQAAQNATTNASANTNSGKKLNRRQHQERPQQQLTSSTSVSNGDARPMAAHHQQQQNGPRQTQSSISLSHQNNNVHEQFGSAMRQLFRDQGVAKALSSANHIFLQRELPLSPQYEWAVKHHYGTDLRLVDFQNQSKTTAALNSSGPIVNATQPQASSNNDNIQQLINELVERQTRGRISNFLSSPVPTSTLLIALNVLFFKGDWQYKFDPADTDSDAWFTRTNGRTVKVPMMVNKLPLAHAHDPAMRTSLIELPYKIQRLGLFILLPDEVDGIFNTLQMLTPSSFANLISMMRKPPAGSSATQGASSPGGGTGALNDPHNASGAGVGINVRIPKFTIESSPRMSQILSQQLGLRTLFSPDQADLSGMFQQRPVVPRPPTTDQSASSVKTENLAQSHAPAVQVGLEELLHKAVLQVHEQGSVAAAASATIVERVGLFNGQYFEADHPFLLFLMDKQTGLVLFSGVFAGPLESGQDLAGDSLTGHRHHDQSGSTSKQGNSTADSKLSSSSRNPKQTTFS